MKYLKKSTFYLNKSQRFGLYLLFILILLFEIFQNFSFQHETYVLTDSDKALLESYKTQVETPKSSLKSAFVKDSLKPFNPNNFSQEDWMKIGFSERQAEVILKYKGIVGGEFTSKEQIKKCYVIDEEKYKELESFILLPEKSTSTFETKYPENKVTYNNFNPNDLPQQGWERIGFTPKQAEVIMKYKQIVGGKFTSKEQIKKCFVISDEKYNEMQRYILLPERTKQDEKLTKQQTGKRINYVKFNPNDYAQNDWQKIGFSSKQAESILKYKRILGGEFKSKEQIKKCYMISDEKYNEMQAFIDLPETVEYKPEKPKVEEKSIERVNIQGKFNPNDLSLEDWIKLGFTEKQATTILNYKRSLGGKFKDAKTLKKAYSISEEKYKEIEPHLIFE